MNRGFSVTCAMLVLAVVGLVVLPACRPVQAPEAPPPSVEPTYTPDPSFAATEPNAVPDAVEPDAPVAAAQVPVSAYFLDAEKVAPSARTVAGPAVAKAAMSELLQGPSDTERAQGLSSAVPAGTKLNGVSIASGTATVDLSEEFTSGGGTLSMSARVAQVVFTLTQFRSVQRVTFRIDGKPLSVLGGEGIVLSKPQTRADWEEFAPAVLIERPAWNDTLSVGRERTTLGSANVFEAVFFLELTAADGRVLDDARVQATSGTGTRGAWTAVLSIPKDAKTGQATLTAYYLSPKDGSRVDVAAVPLRLVDVEP